METKEEIETTVCPWDVTTVEAFLYYICPECDVKAKDSTVFMSHAIECHELARYYVSNYDKEPIEDLPDIKPDIILHEDEDDSYNESMNLDYEETDQDYEPDYDPHFEPKSIVTVHGKKIRAISSH